MLFIQKGEDGKPEVLIDPNAWSADGTARLAAFAPSRDGQYCRLRSLAQRFGLAGIQGDGARHAEDAADTIEWVKVSGVAWHGDGFYYSRYPAPVQGKEKASINENHQVYFHKVGTPQAEDVLVYQDAANPQRFHTVETTEDERFAMLTISERGKGKDGNALYIRDLSKGDAKFRPVVSAIDDDSYGVVDNVDDKLLVQTNRKAPNWRVVLVDPAHPEETNWKDVLPEKPEPLDAVTTAGGKLFATYLKDVMTRAYVYRLDGTLENEVALPGPGSAGGFGGPHDDAIRVLHLQLVERAPLDLPLRHRDATEHRVPSAEGSRLQRRCVRDDAGVLSEQGWHPHSDVPRPSKGLKLDGNNPTLLYAYGGFNVVESPTFSAARLALLEQGFVYASANIRGGGEYGEKWHEQGMKLKKQNVFDDFIAAAEWLIEKKYTSSTGWRFRADRTAGCWWALS